MLFSQLVEVPIQVYIASQQSIYVQNSSKQVKIQVDAVQVLWKSQNAKLIIRNFHCNF